VAPAIGIPSFIHWYELPPEATIVIVEPAQIFPEVGLMVPVGELPWVITALLDAGPEQLPLNIVAVYVPGAVAVYVEDVAPLMSIPSFFH
jgi:hypothetical protein